MNLYSKKQYLKIFLLSIASIFIGISLYVSSNIVNEVAKRERERVTQWADAIKKRAELVRLTNQSFEELRNKELNEMQLWIDATKEISKKTTSNFQQSYDFILKIINKNKDIPVIVLDQDDNVSSFININFTVEDIENKAKKDFPYAEHLYMDSLGNKIFDQLFMDSLVKLAHSWGTINQSFTIEVYDDMYMSYYYSDSRSISRLEKERDSLILAFNKELIENKELVPVVLTDSTQTKVITSNLPEENTIGKNLPLTLLSLKSSNPPIPIHFSEDETNYIFYAVSPELKTLQYFPYIQFLIIGLFIFIGYVIFSTFRKAEQNQVWAGMAKETAHQLGTPISSLMAWIQLLKENEEIKNYAIEMDKDVNRLTQISERFSKIGATTQLENADIVSTIKNFLSYFKVRFSKNIELRFSSDKDRIILAHNPSLLEWVIENICKNAIDAMEGSGKIDVEITSTHNFIYIDITDNGKGMTKQQQRNIFKPGFTTKKRGWGLGMSLSKRIIKEYHKGKIKVLNSEVGKGTTFRITLYIR